MNTNQHAIPDWTLGTTRRCVRGTIGAAAIATILLVPGLNEAWLFLLAMIGAYESLTAILDADLVYGVLYLTVSAVQEKRRKEKEVAEDVSISSPLIVTRYGRQDYQTAA